MKAPRVLFFIAFILAALAGAPLPRSLADDMADKEAVLKLLTTGSWKITYQKGWAIVRVFAKDGLFTTPGRPDETGHWKISGATLTQTYDDGRKDVFTLPPIGGGMAGIARDGETMKAIHIDTAPAPDPPIPPGQSAQERESTIELLTSGAWKVTGMASPSMRVFAKDGSFITVANAGQNGSWRIAGNVIVLTFDDGHKNLIMLPLNAKGAAGADSDGAPSFATLVNTGAPDNRPAQSGTAAAITEQQKAAATALLVSAPWKCTSGGWFAVRDFAKDGTFTTVGAPKGYGVWEFANDMVVLTFQNGSRQTLSLPLNPQGTDGLDNGGHHFTAVLGTPSDQSTPPASALAYLTPTPRPLAIDEAATTTLLLSAPWKFNGGWYSRIRVFAADGTFKTRGYGSEHGVWKISDNMLVLTYPDGHNDTVTLPLNPKGTDASGKGGSPVTVILVNPTPTPADSSAIGDGVNP